MGTVTLPKLNQTGSNEWADVEDNDKALRDEINGNIENVNIDAAAAIAHSKLADITAGRVLMGNSSNVPTATAISGDATLASTGALTLAANSVSTTEITDSSVTAAKIELGALQSDGNSTLTNLTPSTWTNSGCTLTAASTGLYLVTCAGVVTNNAATVGAPNIGSRLVQNLTPVETLNYQVEIGSSADLSWPFSHSMLIELTATDTMVHQVYSSATGTDVPASSWAMRMIRLSS